MTERLDRAVDEQGSRVAAEIWAKAAPFYGTGPFKLTKAAMYIASQRLRVAVQNVMATDSSLNADGMDDPALIVLLAAGGGTRRAEAAESAVPLYRTAIEMMDLAGCVDDRFAEELAWLRHGVVRPGSIAEADGCAPHLVVALSGAGTFGSMLRRAVRPELKAMETVSIPAGLLRQGDGATQARWHYLQDPESWGLVNERGMIKAAPAWRMAIGNANPTVEPATSSAGPTKVCPDCAETVQAAARICRYCRHEFGAEGDGTTGGGPAQ